MNNAKRAATPWNLKFKLPKGKRVSVSNSRLQSEQYFKDSDGWESRIQIEVVAANPNDEQAVIDKAVRACNTHDDLVDAVRELHALCLRLGIDKRTDINLAPITNAQIAFSNATTLEYRAALTKAGVK